MVVEERDTLRRRNLLDDEVGLVGAIGLEPPCPITRIVIPRWVADVLRKVG